MDFNKNDFPEMEKCFHGWELRFGFQRRLHEVSLLIVAAMLFWEIILSCMSTHFVPKVSWLRSQSLCGSFETKYVWSVYQPRTYRNWAETVRNDTVQNVSRGSQDSVQDNFLSICYDRTLVSHFVHSSKSFRWLNIFCFSVSGLKLWPASSFLL